MPHSVGVVPSKEFLLLLGAEFSGAYWIFPIPYSVVGVEARSELRLIVLEFCSGAVCAPKTECLLLDCWRWVLGAENSTGGAVAKEARLPILTGAVASNDPLLATFFKVLEVVSMASWKPSHFLPLTESTLDCLSLDASILP